MLYFLVLVSIAARTRPPQLVASCSEDTTVKVWGIPEDGFKETETEALITLQGHGRKVTLLRFHPTANNVLARYAQYGSRRRVSFFYHTIMVAAEGLI